MIPGPDSIFACPECEHRIAKGSLRSGNTLHSVLYSDGKLVAPMMPDFPDLIKCSRCGAFFWLHNLNKIETIELYMYDIINKEKPEREKPERAEFPSLEEYIEALNKGEFHTEDEELILRRNIWWAFNDRVRDEIEMFSTSGQREIWETNLRKFQSMLNLEEPEESLMIAETHRNLEEFSKCMELLNILTNSKIKWAVKTLKEECRKENPLVIKLR